MADTQEAIRRLSIQATTSGVVDATKQLNDLAKAQGGVAVASASTEKATLSLDQKFASLEKRYVAGVAAQAQYEKTQRLVNAAVAQNPALQDRANAILSAAKERHDQLANSQKALGVITGDLNSRVQAAAGSFGVAGQALSALGPAGLAAAAVFGTIGIGFNIASDAAHALAEKSKELREFAEATGLTTQQVQALKSEAGKFGIDSETLSGGIQKFTAGFQQLRLGTGDLLTQIRRINPALADQIQGAQDAATAFTLFGKAVSQTDNIFQRNALLKAGLGKGSAIFGEFFSSAPDVAGLTAAFTAAGKGLDENLIKKLAQLQVEIDKTRGASRTIFASVFAEDVLKAEKAFADVLLDISKAFKALSDFKFPTLNIPDVPDWVKTALSIAAKGLPVIGPAIGVASAAKDAISAGASSYDSSFHGTSPANNYATFQAPGTSAVAAVAELTPDALAAKLKDLVSVLGSAASPAEKLQASIAELGVKARDAGVGADALARGVAGLRLDTAISVQNAHNAALGQSASITDIVKAKTLDLANAQRQGAGLTKDQIAFQIQYARNTALGVTQLQGQIDAENVRAATLTMGTQAAIAYEIVQTKINEARAKGAPLTEQEIADLQKSADAYAKTKVAADTYSQVLQEVKQAGTQFATDLVQGLLSGKNAMESLASAAKSLGQTLVNSGIKNIIEGLASGNLIQAAAGAVQTGVGALAQWFGGKSEAQKKAEEELRQAQEQWHKMADQVTAFNQAAAGLDLGPITQGIQSLVSSYTQLAEAANKAKEYGSVAQLQATFNIGLNRLVNSFISGTPVMTDLQKQMKAVMDEGQGMIETLISLGAATDATIRAIQDSINRQQSDLQRAFIANTEASLVADIRNNAGLGYLNTIGDAIQKFNSDISQGISSGVAGAWLYSTAQAAVDSAKLSGSAFQDMLAIFPELTGKLHEFVDAAANASERLSLQLRLLSATTDSSTLSGALALFDAKAKQEYDAAVAAGSGNLTLLLQVQSAERQNIIDNFAKQAADAEKQLADQRLAQIQRIQQYLDNLTGGSQSTLAPRDRLAAAQSQFTSQLSAARGGDQNAIQNITSYSDNLLQAARDYYASSQGYQDILQQVQSSLAGLISTGLISGAGTSGLPGTTGSTSVGSVISGSTSTPAAANTNSLSAVVSAISDLSGKVVVLQTKLDTINTSVNSGNAIAAQASVDEGAKLDKIVSNTAPIVASSGLALAATR